MSVLEDTANSIVASLEMKDWGDYSPKIEKKYIPDYQPSELTNMVVCVVPRNTENTMLSRAIEQDMCMIDIGILKKMERKNQAKEIPDMLGLAEETRTYLAKRDFGLAKYKQISFNPHISEEHLGNNVFVSILSAQYHTEIVIPR